MARKSTLFGGPGTQEIEREGDGSPFPPGTNGGDTEGVGASAQGNGSSNTSETSPGPTGPAPTQGEEDRKGETLAERFHRLASIRTSNALDAMRGITKLA